MNEPLGSDKAVDPEVQSRCQDYLGGRTGTYEWRCLRYATVADELFDLGLKNDMSIIDVGAGFCEFDHYLRTTRGWRGIYVPVDGHIDGTNLEFWEPKFMPDFMVAIEILEHLRHPLYMMGTLQRHSRLGAVATTPNPDVVNVLACDPTHVSEVNLAMFEVHGWLARTATHFGKRGDTLVAIWRPQF